MTRRWVTEFGGLLGMRPLDFVGMEGITEHNMLDYLIAWGGKTEAHFLGQYLPWDSHRNAENAIAMGMECQLPCRANWWEFENQDNLDTYWHDRGMFLKFGFGRFCSQISVDVRSGKIAREDAMRLVADRDGAMCDTYMGLSVWDSADRIGMSKSEFQQAMDAHTNWQIFKRVVDDGSSQPILIG